MYTLRLRRVNQKSQEWLIAVDVPCKVLEKDDEFVIVNQFTSATGKQYIIKNSEFKYLSKCIINDGYICNLRWYPDGKLKLTEFDERKKVSSFVSVVKKLINSLPKNDKIRFILEKKILPTIKCRRGHQVIILKK